MKYDILYCHLSLSFLFFSLLCVPFKDEGWCVDKTLFNFLTGENVYGLTFLYGD